ncbi:MAG: TetR/AcrR family transcriptional regulator [Euryarchaeota archaeon]|nr:TetR/AcrR family transcriptional regulator [Euryarchaeota archaeon]
MKNIIFDRPVEPTGRMPLARYESIDSSLKERILDVSKQEFSTHGFEAASYNKIIQKIGISKGSMYYYFENKEDLFITCFIDEARSSSLFSPNTILFSQIDDIEIYWNSIKSLYQKLWSDAFRHPLLMSLIRQMTVLGTEHQIVGKLYAECEGLSEYGEFMDILEHGIKIGAIRNDTSLDVLNRMSNEFELWLLQELQERRLSEQQVVERSFQMFVQLFENKR